MGNKQAKAKAKTAATSSPPIDEPSTKVISKTTCRWGSSENAAVSTVVVDCKPGPTPTLIYVRDEDAEDIPQSYAEFELLAAIEKDLFKVRRRDQFFTMKRVRIEPTTTQWRTLRIVHHPFLRDLLCAFVDMKPNKNQLFLVYEHVPTLSLMHLQTHFRNQTERQVREYAACVVLVLEFLHDNGLMYTDLSIEEFWFDDTGFPQLTGASLLQPDLDQFPTAVDYLSPEEISEGGEKRTPAADYWALGIFMHELLTGLPPFYYTDAEEMQYAILNKPVLYHELDGWISDAAKDLIERLLIKDKHHRLTCITEIKTHPFFEGMDWNKLYNKQFKSSCPQMPSTSPWDPDPEFKGLSYDGAYEFEDEPPWFQIFCYKPSTTGEESESA